MQLLRSHLLQFSSRRTEVMPRKLHWEDIPGTSVQMVQGGHLRKCLLSSLWVGVCSFWLRTRALWHLEGAGLSTPFALWRKGQLSTVELAPQLVVSKATASSYLDACHKCRILGPTLDLLSHDLHFNKTPRQYMCSLRCQKPMTKHGLQGSWFGF